MSQMQNGTMLTGTWDPNAGLAAQQADDSKVWAQFRMHPVVDGPASKEAGRTIKKDVIYVKITQPGEANLSVYDQPATQEDMMRFPRQFAQFQANQEQTVSGSRLDLLFPESPAIVENLKVIGFRTIEQLAEANDTALQTIGMGGRQWHEKAKAYLAQANGGAGFHVLNTKLEQMDLKIQELTDRNNALEAALAEATAKNSKKQRDAA